MILSIKKIDSNKTEIDEKSYKNILIYCIKHGTIKEMKY